MKFFTSTPHGLEDLLAAEIARLGGQDPHLRHGGVEARGSLETLYRTCLESRLASRVLLPLRDFRLPGEDPYREASRVDWSSHLGPDHSLAVSATIRRRQRPDARWASVRVKDAVVDQLRRRSGRRPDVDRADPDLRLHLFVDRDRATLSLDLSGTPLHRRGYRREGLEAPLKEHLAAGILMRAGWPERPGPLLDPFCGSGTLLVEGLEMALGLAPGRHRTFGFERWIGHDDALWQRIRKRAVTEPPPATEAPLVFGSDRDPNAILASRQSLAAAGLEDRVELATREFFERKPPTAEAGLLVANLPYGERLSNPTALARLYRELGPHLKQAFPGWRASLFTGDPEARRSIRLRAERVHKLRNGPLSCELLHYDIGPARDDTD